jgi:hypothetical protein
LNWGGWWAWDFVELVNLNILLFFLTQKHTTPYLKNNYPFISINLLLIVVTYVYTRYNLIPSIHSFLSELSFLQYDYVVNIGILVVIYFFYKILFDKIFWKYRIYFNYKYNYVINTYFMCMSILFISLVLVNMYFKGITILYIKIFQLFLFSFIIFYLILMCNFDTPIKLTLVFNPILVLFYTITSNYLSIWKNFRKIHYLIFIFILFVINTWGIGDLLFYNNTNCFDKNLPYFLLKVDYFLMLNFKKVYILNNYLNLGSKTVTEVFFFKRMLFIFI